MTTTISGSNGIVFPDATSMQTGQQAVKAWVNFNGVGTVAIRASYGVSSISDNGTGDYTVNFTTAMTDVNYCVTTSTRYSLASNNVVVIQNIGNYTPVVGSVRLSSASAVGTNTAQIDVESFNVAVFR